MKGKRKKIQDFFIYIIMLAASAFLIFGGVKQLMMTQDLKASIEQKKEEKKNLKFELQNFQKSCLSLFALDLLTGAASHILHT